MNKIPLPLVILLFFLISISELFSQKIIFEESPVTYSGLPQIRKIIFLDTLRRKQITYDLLKNNPFNKLKFPVLDTTDPGNLVYQLSYGDVLRIIPKEYRTRYCEDRRQVKNYQSTFTGSSSTYLYKESRKYVIIANSFFIGQDTELTVGVLGSIDVFNNKGVSIYKARAIDVNIMNPVITENGKYLYYTFGSDDEAGFFLQEGYRLLDLRTKKVIIERRHESIGTPFVVNNLIINGYSIYEPEEKHVYIVVDSESQIIYTKEYSFKENFSIKEINDKGFHISNHKKNEERFDSFEEKFQKEKIN